MSFDYFAQFPTVFYDLNGSGVQTLVRDITKSVKILESIRNSAVPFYPYTVKEGETPDIVAKKYYGDHGYFWLVLLANVIVDPYFGWAMTQDQFDSWIEKTFGSVIAAQQEIHHYEDTLGNWIDEPTYQANVETSSIIYTYNYYLNLNEQKRNIRLISKEYQPQIESEIISLLTSASS